MSKGPTPAFGWRRLDGRGRVGASLVALGLGLVVVGSVGAITDAGPPALTTTTASPTASPTLGATTSPAPTPRPTGSPDDLAVVQAFFADLVAASRAKDVDRLMAWLHPATIERYGADACRAFLETRDDPTFDITVDTVKREPFPYTTDGRVAEIREAFTVGARVTNEGTTTARELHVGLVEGQVRWFTDCGTPLAATPAP